METFESVAATGSSNCSGSSSSSSVGNSPAGIDGLLADAGYKVKSSELRHVAHRLERLETVMVNAPAADISLIASDSVLYNPSDLACWVDSLLSEFNQPQLPLPSHLADFPTLNPTVFTDNNFLTEERVIQQQLTVVKAMEEDSGIRLVHMLITCAELVQCGDIPLACSVIEEMRSLLTRVNTSCGIGKVAGYFIDALSRRILDTGGSICFSAYENEMLYQHFYEACPYLKFAHFTANQAILEAFDGHDFVHVVDFNLMHGLQWPALIQALALRPGGPPLLRLTGIGPPSPDGRDSLREIGLKLADLARSVNIRFAFRGVAASRLEDVKPWMLQVSSKEALAVNSIMQLHKLSGSGSDSKPYPLLN